MYIKISEEIFCENIRTTVRKRRFEGHFYKINYNKVYQVYVYQTTETSKPVLKKAKQHIRNIDPASKILNIHTQISTKINLSNTF